ncbi:MAG: protein kinase [Myxococcaceae bacterium]|nr:protein kinase [Myxococcaceae bacterium]
MLGEGGMGKVYKANQIALDKPIVLKVLRQALLSDERTVARFQREAKAASRLNHPNSIGVIDFGQTEDGALYMAMEFVNGKDLHHILSREWPLPEARIVRIVSQVLSALSDAHKASVIHRDLKPENIMVEQRRGDPDFVKVLDFGIAKIMDGSGEDGPALTRAGFVCGTPEYMSPEQARGAQLDPRSDLYAVGVILYQLTSGLLPFDSDSAVGFATKHLTEVPPPPSKRRPEARISPAMERVIMRALAKDPGDRPQNAESFRAELLAIDKERRAAAPQRRGASGSLQRKVTPIEQQETRITQDPGWGTESTVRAEPPPGREPPTGRAHVGPVPGSDVAHPQAPTTAPNARRSGQPGVDITDRVPPVRGESGGGAGLVFKLAAGVLVVAAIALGGFYVWQTQQKPKIVEPPIDPKHDVPVPGVDKTVKPSRPTGPLYGLEVPIEKRDLVLANQYEAEGDNDWQLNRMDEAREKYLDAWILNPSAGLALKLGEICYQKDETAEAKHWWTRHLKESANSRAAIYINSVLPRE